MSNSHSVPTISHSTHSCIVKMIQVFCSVKMNTMAETTYPGFNKPVRRSTAAVPVGKSIYIFGGGAVDSILSCGEW